MWRGCNTRPFHAGRALLLVVAALLIGSPGAGSAQAAGPLTKTELVRLLSGGVYTEAELASVVRRSCLSFEPTDRDIEDLRSLGASGSVMEAVEWCARPLEVAVEPAGLTVRAGDSGAVTLRASRDGRPVGGLSLTLGTGGGGAAISGVTDEDGVVRLPVPTAGAARSYRLSVRAAGMDVAGSPALAVRVVPGPARAASLSPPIVLLYAGAEEPTAVRAALRDRFGNPVAGVAVSLTDPTTGSGVSTGRTETGGEVELRIAPGAVGEDGVLELRAEGRVLGELAVQVRAREARGEAAGPEPGLPDPARAAEATPTGEEAETDREPAETDREADTADRVPGGLEDLPVSAGDIERALQSYRAAIEAAPRDVALRLELARLLDRANRLREARTAYEDVIALAPGHVDASRALARLAAEGARVDATLSGGATLEGSPGLRSASIAVRPIRSLRVWGRYDRSLAVDGLPLIRGPDEVAGYFGGAALSWGPDRRFTTSVEIGRRVDDVPRPSAAPVSLDQNTVHLEQRVLVPAGRRWAALSAGGYLGRWYDRDDWLAYARVRAPAGERLEIAPAVYTGETVGTDADERGRAAERETRVEVPVRLTGAGGWLVEPAGAVGWVTGADDEPARRLYEARLLAEFPLAEGVAARVFIRHQDAPGSEAFTLGTVGLRLRFD